MKTGVIVLTAAAGVAAFAALFATTPETTPAASTALEEAPAFAAAPTGASPDASYLSGSVREVLQVPGYTYLAVESGGSISWAAVDTIQLTEGTTVTIRIDTVLQNFQSSALNRTFDTVVFGNIADGPATGSPHGLAGHPSAPNAAHPHAGLAGMDQESSGAERAKIEKVDGGHSIEELYAERAKLEGKTVRVRGVVTKSLAGIMGKTFVHLADGTGSPEAKNDDLTVTTTDIPNKGEVAVVAGTLILNKDLGAGYKYDLLVEQATILAQ